MTAEEQLEMVRRGVRKARLMLTQWLDDMEDYTDKQYGKRDINTVRQLLLELEGGTKEVDVCPECKGRGRLAAHREDDGEKCPYCHDGLEVK